MYIQNQTFVSKKKVSKKFPEKTGEVLRWGGEKKIFPGFWIFHDGFKKKIFFFLEKFVVFLNKLKCKIGRLKKHKNEEGGGDGGGVGGRGGGKEPWGPWTP